MAVKIKLIPFGKKGRKTFRLVVAEEKSKRDGKVVEILGFYDPYKLDKVQYNKAQLLRWLQQGAQPTDSVRKIIKI